jgi:hypothetical protein
MNHHRFLEEDLGCLEMTDVFIKDIHFNKQGGPFSMANLFRKDQDTRVMAEPCRLLGQDNATIVLPNRVLDDPENRHHPVSSQTQT